MTCDDVVVEVNIVGSALKVLYLVIRNPIANRTNVTGRTTGWKAALNALALFYCDRITLN